MARESGMGITSQQLVTLLNNEVKNKSLNSIAKASGVGVAALHRYQRGIGEPNKATLKKLSDYFEVSAEWLRGDSPISLEDEKKAYAIMSNIKDGNKEQLATLMTTARCLDLARLKLLNERADELLGDFVEEEAENFDPDSMCLDEDESL